MGWHCSGLIRWQFLGPIKMISLKHIMFYFILTLFRDRANFVMLGRWKQFWSMGDEMGGPWYILENLGELKKLLKIHGGSVKTFLYILPQIFVSRLWHYCAMRAATFHTFERGTNTFSVFEGRSMEIFYHYETFHSPNRNCWQLHKERKFTWLATSCRTWSVQTCCTGILFLWWIFHSMTSRLQVTIFTHIKTKLR